MKIKVTENHSGWATLLIKEKEYCFSNIIGFSRCVKTIKKYIEECISNIENNIRGEIIAWLEGYDLIISYEKNLMEIAVYEENEPYKKVLDILKEEISKEDMLLNLQSMLDYLNSNKYYPSFYD